MDYLKLLQNNSAKNSLRSLFLFSRLYQITEAFVWNSVSSREATQRRVVLRVATRSVQAGRTSRKYVCHKEHYLWRTHIKLNDVYVCFLSAPLTPSSVNRLENPPGGNEGSRMRQSFNRWVLPHYPTSVCDTEMLCRHLCVWVCDCVCAWILLSSRVCHK